MTDQNDNFDENEDESKLLKDLRKQIANRDKLLAEKDNELTSYKTAEKTRSLADVLSTKGFNPKLAKIVPPDIEGEEAITKWLTDMDFAPVSKSNEGEKVPSTKPNVDEETILAAKKLQTLRGNAQAPVTSDSGANKINSANSNAEIEAAFREQLRLLNS